jgi:mannose-6-phosphate isomerase-like protein (cupin superfamily)
MGQQGQEHVLPGFVVRPGEGRQIAIPGVPELATIMVTGTDTGGLVSLHEVWHAPHDPGVPRHLHHHRDELFYVLEGAMRVLVGTEESVAGPGTCVCVPRGTVHAWRPTGAGPVRDLQVVLPGGFEGYFEEMQTLPPPHEAPEAWRELNRRWDVEVVGPPLEDAD